MNTILQILERAGGLQPNLHLRIHNPPYLPLVIDSLETTGPMGRPSIRVAHLSYSNGRLMAPPGMRFEFDDSPAPAVGLDAPLGVSHHTTIAIREIRYTN